MRFFLHISLFLSLALSVCTPVKAQTAVVAHATAEVVETVTLSSSARSEAIILKAEDGLVLELDDVTVKSTGSQSFEVLITYNNITSENGDNFPIEAAVKSSLSNDSSLKPGNCIISLLGNITIPVNQTGHYNTSYKVIAAFN